MFILLPGSKRIVNTDQITSARLDHQGESQFNPASVLRVYLTDGRDEGFRDQEAKDLWAVLENLTREN